MTILVDADDVMVNLLGHWVDMINSRYNTDVSTEDVAQWDMTLAFPTLSKEQIYGVLLEEDFWNEIEPIEGAQKTLQELYDAGHEIFVVSASDYRICKIKFGRIMSLFPWLDWEHIIIASRKQMIKGGVLIDDNPDNLIGGDYFKILFDRPHNREFLNEKEDIRRVETWEDCEAFIGIIVTIVNER